MSFPTFNDLSSFQGPQQNELQQHDSYLQGYLGTQHKDDGSHGDVTADSLHLVKGNPTTGISTGTGNLIVDGTSNLNGPMVAENLTLIGPPIVGGTIPAAIGTMLTAESPKGNSQGSTILSHALDGNAFVTAFAADTANASTGAQLAAQYKNQVTAITQGNNSCTFTVSSGTPYVQFNTGVAERSRTVPMGEWAAFVPTWTNLTIGNGSVSATFMRMGKTSWAEILVVFGSTSVVSGAITITGLPTNNTAVATAQRLGHAVMFDSDTSSLYTGTILTGGSTSGIVYAQGAPLTATGAVAPFAWATSDQLHLWLNYQEV